MEFKNYLEESAKELDKEIKEILDEQIKEAKKIDKKLTPLLAAFAKTCHGGKRIRGVLIKLGYEIAGGSSNISRIAAAYEICHSAILAHDDIIDKSATRRDKPSLHCALGGDHYGDSQAITLADYGFFLAFKIIANTKASGLFTQIMMETAFGQMLELKKANPFLVMKLKTACYTISGPLQIGAVLGDGDKKLIKLLGEFGENLGIAFQIQDDILDSEVDWAGGVDSAKKEAIRYKNQAMKMIPELTKTIKMSKLLEQLAEYLVGRKK